MYKLCFFVPQGHLEVVKSAVFSAGAGRIGDYQHCCWQVLGEGQFSPMEGSRPYLGVVGEVEKVAEWKVELVCESSKIKAAVRALKQAHPYEEVAYEAWQLETI